MSIWADMHRRSTGETVRKEDIPRQEDEEDDPQMWWDYYDTVRNERLKNAQG